MQILNPKLKRNRQGYYEIRYSEKLPDGRYRSRTISTRSNDSGIAKTFLAQFLSTNSTVAQQVGVPLVRDLCDAYEKQALARGVTRGHLCVLRTIRNFFGDMRPADILSSTVRDYNRQNEHKTDSTRRRELAALVTVLNHAKRERLIQPGDVPVIELPPEGDPRSEFLDSEQEAEFWQAALWDSQGELRLTRVTRFVCIALDTGARREAIETLTWDRVSMVWKDGKLVSGLIDFRDPARRKTKKRRAVVPISDRLLPVIEQAFKEKTDAFVCDKGSVKRCFATFVSGACGGKYSWVRPHILRHTAATLRLKAGVSIWDTANMLANSPAMVSKVYGHHRPDHLLNAVNKRADA